ncbi:hypothetical protein GPECTOR_4g603 [Gonium pectorale]|uniref:Uncharacterized protein n=1 Tax=Gonium pectorale TaxID=33097 RepID=A0A150GXX3_GONPE|nr:hypothetical protein GPECTOR_4g603 [Gonium pectorale]|eukprot:KXZ54538.1 hypothetical protein GPECTOR_4g603 [Gonium pectorale]
MLARQWPGNYCSKHSCPLLHDHGFHFTIHGLWPNYNDGTYPQFCDKSLEFDEDKISDLEDELEEEWPSFMGTDGDFWDHEWSKHGTCALSLLPTEHKYFKTVLKLHWRYDLAAALRKADILPSRDRVYKAQELIDAVDDMYGVKPLVHCYGKALSEIWMCFDRNLQPFDCDRSHESNACRELTIPPLHPDTASQSHTGPGFDSALALGSARKLAQAGAEAGADAPAVSDGALVGLQLNTMLAEVASEAAAAEAAAAAQDAAVDATIGAAASGAASGAAEDAVDEVQNQMLRGGANAAEQVAAQEATLAQLQNSVDVTVPDAAAAASDADIVAASAALGQLLPFASADAAAAREVESWREAQLRAAMDAATLLAARAAAALAALRSRVAINHAAEDAVLAPNGGASSLRIGSSGFVWTSHLRDSRSGGQSMTVVSDGDGEATWAVGGVVLLRSGASAATSGVAVSSSGPVDGAASATPPPFTSWLLVAQLACVAVIAVSLTVLLGMAMAALFYSGSGGRRQGACQRQVLVTACGGVGNGKDLAEPLLLSGCASGKGCATRAAAAVEAMPFPGLVVAAVEAEAEATVNPLRAGLLFALPAGCHKQVAAATQRQ